MATKISFGNSIGYNITDNNAKRKILNYLFKSVDIYKLNPKKICEEKDLINIKNNSYNIYPNIMGIDYIFMAKKVKNIFYAVLIDKTNLNDNLNINYNLINIIDLKIRLSKDNYKGTILDGRLVNLGGCSVFIINDCYQLYGNEIASFDKSKIDTFINNSIIIDENMNAVNFKINKLYDLHNIEHVVNDKIRNSKHRITSLVFVPQKENNMKYIHEICPSTEKNIELNFLAKYENTDVVSLHAINDNGEPQKVGIAHIPTIKCSHICNNHLLMDKFTKVLCKLNSTFKKWQPIEIINDDKSDIAGYNHSISCIQNIVDKA